MKTLTHPFVHSVILFFSAFLSLSPRSYGQSNQAPSQPTICLADFGTILLNAQPGLVPPGGMTGSVPYADFIPAHFGYAVQSGALPFLVQAQCSDQIDVALANIAYMKQLNSNLKVFGYWNMTFQYATVSQPPTIDIDGVTATSSSSMFLHDPATNDLVYAKNNPFLLVMDPSDAGWQTNSVTNNGIMLQQSAYDGYEIDDVWFDLASHLQVNQYRDINWVQFMSNETAPSPSAAIISMAGSFYGTNFDQNIFACLSNVTNALSNQFHKMAFINGIQGGADNYNQASYFNPSAGLNPSDLPLPAIGGFSMEGFATNSPYSSFLLGSAWLNNVSQFISNSSGKTFALAANYGAPSTTCPYLSNLVEQLYGEPFLSSLTPAQLQNVAATTGLNASMLANLDQLMNQRIYGMASYLLAESSISAYVYTPDDTYLYYFPEFDVNYGTASNNSMISVSFQDPNNVPAKATFSYYQRTFTNATVYLNPNNFTSADNNFTPDATIKTTHATLWLNLQNENVGGIPNNPNFQGAADPAFTNSPGVVQYIYEPANTSLVLPPSSALILMNNATFELESLAVSPHSTDSTRPVTGSQFSRGTALVLTPTVNGNKYTCTIPNFPKGVYSVIAQVEKGPAAATQWYATIGAPQANVVNSTVQNDYSSTMVYAPDNLGIWTNGVTGDKVLTFYSSGPVTIDYLQFTPQ